MALTGSHLIGGAWTAASPGRFSAREASTGEELGPGFATATADEVDRAVRAAHDAFERLQSVPTARVADFLESIATKLEASGPAIIERAGRETGLPNGRLEGELARTANQIRLFAAVLREGSWVDARIDPGNPDRKPLPKPDVRTMLVGVGPVAVFGASNFPLAISVAGTDTISAFAARCPVVVKAHPAHPGTCELIAGVIDAAVAEADMPRGMFSLMQGAENAVGAALVQHPLTKAVAFTGSLRGGRALADLAAAREYPIPVYAEMGSSNPVFLLPGALASRAAEIAAGYVGSVTLGVGQFCTNPGLVFVQRGPGADAFVDAVRSAGGEVSPAPMLTAGIHGAYCEGVNRLAALDGVEPVVRTAGETGSYAGCEIFQAEASLLETHPGVAEEVFGPTSLILVCDDFDQMVAIARGLDGQLTATLHADGPELTAVEPLLRVLRSKAGRLVFNGFPTGIEVCAAMHHGGPYPATTVQGYTSIGPAAIRRFAAPVCYQNAPAELLPAELQDANPDRIWRLVDGETSRDAIG